MTSEGLTKETLGLRLPLFRIPIAAASNVFGVVRKRAALSTFAVGVALFFCLTMCGGWTIVLGVFPRGRRGRAPRFSYLNPKHP